MRVADERGLELTTSNAAAVQHYDTTVRHYLEYRTDTLEHLGQVLAADPECVMGHCLNGYFCLLAGTVTTLDAARQSLDYAEAHSTDLTQRECTHIAALRAWYIGDLFEACRLWDEILIDHPTDVLALRLQHFTTFWTGRSIGLRDSVARVFHAWDEQTPGYSYVLGMYAFGLEEAGDYATAEAYGKRAVELNPDDLWAIHAVAHVLEMQGRLHDGITWLDYPLNAWDDRNAMKNHLWWHLALFPFELGDYDRVLALYDAAIGKDKPAFYIEIQNVASLLMRLECQGVEVGDRWQQLVEICEARLDDHAIAFTDLHVMMVLAAAGHDSSAQRLLQSLQRFAGTPHSYAATTMTGVTIPVCEAILAYSKGDYDTVLDRLLPIRYDYTCVGGSHAQRDVLAQLLIDAALKAERLPLARALLAERLGWRPHSRGSWLKYATVLEGLGDTPGAQEARVRAVRVASNSTV